MSAIEQPGVQIGKHYDLMVSAQYIRTLGHEMHAAKRRCNSLPAERPPVAKVLEIAPEIGKLYHLVALVMMPQDDQARP